MKDKRVLILVGILFILSLIIWDKSWKISAYLCGFAIGLLIYDIIADKITFV